MAAFSFETSNKAWMRVKIALAGANAGIVGQFKELKSYYAQVYPGVDMQFLSFTDAQTVDADGTNLATGAGKLIAVYVKKNGTDGAGGTATDAYLKVYDNATVDTTASEGLLAIPLLADADQRCYIDPQGLQIDDGVVITSHTTIAGSTDSTADDVGNGFVLVANR